MVTEKEPVLEFERSRKQLAAYFGCEGDFFLKPLPELEWALRQDEDFTFLSYWMDRGKRVDAVVVKKNGAPMIYKTKDYTMVVAIDCVKIGFIFCNKKSRMP